MAEEDEIASAELVSAVDPDKVAVERQVCHVVDGRAVIPGRLVRAVRTDPVGQRTIDAILRSAT